MKVLLVTDMPPCKNYTAGLVLDQLLRFLPKGSVSCYVVLDRNVTPNIAKDLEWVPMEYSTRPRENWNVHPKQIGKLASMIFENTYSNLSIRRIASKAIDMGKKFGADAVWCILEGQTMIKIAVPISKGLGVPLFTHVWDPPFWWLRANAVDKISSTIVLGKFGQALKNSAVCGTASWNMADEYERNFGVKSVALLPCIDSCRAIPPSEHIHPGNQLVIGMAGQIYATDEWNALIKALDSVNWRLCGRHVRIRLLGRYANLNANGKMMVEFLGWTSQAETIKLMSECDILYCPYWFDPAFENEARLSFPSKLTSYLASGRPVLFHGPEYASPAMFLKDNEAGICCHSLNPSQVVETLTNIILDKQLYSNTALNGTLAFNKYLTLSSMRSSFANFLQVDEEWLLPVHRN